MVRTAARPRLGRPLLDEAAVAELTELLLADAPRLRATAAWFTQLKRQRRALRITAGNVQDAGRFTGTAELDETAARRVATSSVHIGLVVGVAAEGVSGTTAQDRAEVVALVRAREALPSEARTLAERAAAGFAGEEF